VEFTYEGGSPLEKHPSFKQAPCPRCGAPARRETDTMDTFFDSSWYFFRYCGKGGDLPFDPREAKKWMPVDLYIGGIEHAILHLIYARFFCKLFRDFGWTDQKEPFPHLLTQGMVTLGGSKMSKSKGNIVDPSALIAQYGADTARLFTLFAAPPEKSLEWSDKGVEGCHRFLQRVWTFCERWQGDLTAARSCGQSASEGGQDLLIKLHKTIKKVSEDIEDRFHLNTAIAALMEFFNLVSANEDLVRMEPGLIRHAMETMLKLLNPFTPHFANEIWSRLGNAALLENESWPVWQQAFIDAQQVNVMIQINGKIRDKLVVPCGRTEAEISSLALELEKIKPHLDGKTIVKTVFILDKMISYVVK
jgi:leucyl-tRNA synthetase